MDVWSNKLLAADGHLVRPLGPLRSEWSFAQQLLHRVTAQHAVACFCCHQLLRRTAGFGISVRKCWSAFSVQRMGLWIPVDKQESQPEAWCFPKSNSSCSGTATVQHFSILQPYKTKVKTFSVCSDQRELTYLHWLLCPKTYINKYRSYGHRYCYSCYLYIM